MTALTSLAASVGRTASLGPPPRGRRSTAPLFIAILFAAAMAINGVAGFNAVARAGRGPMETTTAMVDQALGVLRDTHTPLAERRRQLRAVIEPSFNFTAMSRSALGYHWRSLDPDQRANFTRLFTAFIEDAYLSKIQNYSGQQVVIVKQVSLGEGYAEVDTKIVQQGKDPILVNYLLEEHDDDWKIYDVTVDAISITENYRNQFNRVMNESGFDKLMADLTAKQQELASSLGNPS